MKRRVLIIMTVLLLMITAACSSGSGKENNSEKETPSQAAERYLKSIQEDPKLLLQHPSLKDTMYH